MRLTGKNGNKYGFITENNTLGVFVDGSIADKCYTKLGQLEDIEEELGIDLLTLFKALKQQNVWTKYENEIDLCDTCEYMLLDDFIYFYWDNGKHLTFELKDYSKTWALTKEELL